MKKYKLIKKYPGSPKVGDIVKGYGRDGWYSKGEGHSTYDWRQVVNYPDYWEEVVEKDYEIISFKQDSGITDLWTKFTGGWSRNINGYPTTVPYTLEDILKNDLYTIHSVKRLSDGEIFTVGDKFTGYAPEESTIREFNLQGNILVIQAHKGCISNAPGTGLFNSIKKVVEKDYQILKSCPIEGTIYSVERLSDGEVFTLGDKIKVYQHGSTNTIDSIDLYGNTSSMKEGIWLRYSTGSCHMTHIIKQKPQPIYLTHDGKDIFPEDTVWYVNKENFYHDYIKAYPEVKFNSDIRAYFLTEEEAKKYIIENKPALSIKEFWEITWMSTSGFNKHTYMKNLVKQRLNLK